MTGFPADIDYPDLPPLDPDAVEYLRGVIDQMEGHPDA